MWDIQRLEGQGFEWSGGGEGGGEVEDVRRIEPAFEVIGGEVEEKGKLEMPRDIDMRFFVRGGAEYYGNTLEEDSDGSEGEYEEDD